MENLQPPQWGTWRNAVLSGQTLLGFREWLTKAEQAGKSTPPIPLQPTDVLRSAAFYGAEEEPPTVVLVRRNALETGEEATRCGFWWSTQDVSDLRSFRLRHLGGWFFSPETERGVDVEAYLDGLGFLRAEELDTWRKNLLTGGTSGN